MRPRNLLYGGIERNPGSTGTFPARDDHSSATEQREVPTAATSSAEKSSNKTENNKSNTHDDSKLTGAKILSQNNLAADLKLPKTENETIQTSLTLTVEIKTNNICTEELNSDVNLSSEIQTRHDCLTLNLDSCMNKAETHSHKSDLNLNQLNNPENDLKLSESDQSMAAEESTAVNYSCSGCGRRIMDRFLLRAVDGFWHEDCLRCSCCDCRLSETGCTLYTRAELLLCKRDYLRMFGETGQCFVCSKMIPAYEFVMRSGEKVFHIDCFSCQLCNHRFCIGDRYYMFDNNILCEFDYFRRTYALQQATNKYPTLTTSDFMTNNCYRIQETTDDSSSGYGSPSPATS